ncbi:MAG: Uma2 family endonuclease [Blautia sp.]|nr:Uma2 family endonuclease [Blautia sp.]
MTIQEMKNKKQELGYSNQYLSKISGIPEPTIQKIFSGHTKSPRQATIRALEKALFPQVRTAPETVSGYRYPQASPGGASAVAEASAAYAASQRIHTIDEIYALPEGVHAELIDGQIYYMASPTRQHQEIIGELHFAVAGYIKSHGGSCKVYIPPFAVFLFGDDSTYLEPDLTIVCDPNKLDDRGCVGAPDWVVEVLSPSSTGKDRILKMLKYRTAGVREYWIIDPFSRTVSVYLFDMEDAAKEQALTYSFEDTIHPSLYPDLEIRLASFYL